MVRENTKKILKCKVTVTMYIEAIVRLKEAEVVEARKDMVYGYTISKPRLLPSKTSIRGYCHCNKFYGWMLSLIGIIHPVIAINC